MGRHLQPQSAFAALNVAHVRRLLGDLDGTEQAFRIAALRDDLGIVDYFKALDEYLGSNFQNYIGESIDSTLIAELRDSSDGILRGEFLIGASIHTGTLSSHPSSEIQTCTKLPDRVGETINRLATKCRLNGRDHAVVRAETA